MQQDIWNKIDSRYRLIVDELTPYIFSNPLSFSHFQQDIWGLKIEKHISCLNSQEKNFFFNLQALDAFSFGPVGMPMERWVFFDCGEMPGGIFGFGIEAKKLPAEVLQHYKYIDSDDEFLPLSMYIAIPMVGGAWFGHNLCSANSVLRGHYTEYRGLALLTKALGTICFGITDHFGATQWKSGSLNIHLQLSEMELRSAFTPAHSFDETITYYSYYGEQKILQALSSKTTSCSDYDFLVESSDRKKIIELQGEIERGAMYKICGRPIYQDNKTFLPIKKGKI